MPDAAQQLEQLLADTLHRLRAQPTVQAHLARLADDQARTTYLAQAVMEELHDDERFRALAAEAAGVRSSPGGEPKDLAALKVALAKAEEWSVTKQEATGKLRVALEREQGRLDRLAEEPRRSWWRRWLRR
jgi:hypothetical protein